MLRKRVPQLFLSILLLKELVLTTAYSVRRPRIIGGQLANSGQFPWAAAIYKTTSDGNYFCGGTLLSPLWLLTAGQCVDGGIIFTIDLGITNLQERNDYQIRLATELYYLHPDYNPETLENDIGILRFRQSITMNMYVSALPRLQGVLNAGTPALAVGWGQISDSEAGLSSDLRWVDVTTISNEECKIYYGSQIKDNMVCVAGQYNEGPCFGDIGGPLIRIYGSAQVRTIAGIASFVSSNGCESAEPAGYTRYLPYVSWLHNVTSSW